ncbi:MAG TPA: efflux RND transporter periplasmic adaptor subunit [Casimicrobiaceae bacterium]|nr:efflux RND transporter periplasmic adaptor subunit [Casimicrobiaceae bacterium]
MDHPPPSSPTTAATGTDGTGRRRSRWSGRVIAVVGLAALAGLAWYLTHRAPAPATGGFGPGGNPGARGAPPSTVGVATASRANIPVIIESLGTVVSAASVTVTPQVSGVVTQVLYTEGQMVQKGEVLAIIDPKPFELALAQAGGARSRDAAQLDAARVLLARYRTLLKEDSIARQTVDTQDALVQQLAGTVALDRANEDSARLNLQWSRIVAPVAGRVGLRPIDAGNYIAAGSSGGVATITQVSPIDVQFSIPQDRIPDVRLRIAAGATLPVTAWDSGRTRQLEAGSFLTLDNQIDTQTGTIKAKARFANTRGTLYPNQFVNVRLLLRTIDSAVVIPVIALRHGPNGDFVYVVNADHTVKLRDVVAGISGVDNVAITKGLALGEEVVTEGGDRLKDGARVRTGAEAPAGAAPAANAGQPRRGSGNAGSAAR